MLFIITLSLVIFNHVLGGILDCDNKYQSKDPEKAEDAVWCADEGGSCSGPGRIYYGAALTWTYVDLNYGETIDCSNGDFGCDPLNLFTKKCYKKEKFQYVYVNFTQIKILKTKDDGVNGDGVEEWDVYDSDPGITMHVDFGDEVDLWHGCDFYVYQLRKSQGFDEDADCTPPDDTEDSDGFYDCVIAGYPYLFVSAAVYESGLKYSFNFQIGDFDADDEFDDGPTWDFTYTEPDHRSISDLADEDERTVIRYFTRWDSNKDRRARLYLTYTLEDAVQEYPYSIISCD